MCGGGFGGNMMGLVGRVVGMLLLWILGGAHLGEVFESVLERLCNGLVESESESGSEVKGWRIERGNMRRCGGVAFWGMKVRKF